MATRKKTPGAKTASGKLRKGGATFTKKVTRGTNKGDTTKFKVAKKSRKPYPTAVKKDRGPKSTLRNNSGVKVSGQKR